MVKKIIAIDGPAGAGKSTIAKKLAKELHYLYIDTGAMYRAVALAAIRQGIAIDEEEKLSVLAKDCQIRLQNDGEEYRVFLNGKDVSKEIRLPEVSAVASPVSAIGGVRRSLVAQQQDMAKEGCVVMDGRDIGTKVLPQADCKIFLTASLEERAKRRFLELQEKGLPDTYEQVKEDIRQRDDRDSNRANSPLKQAEDAYLLDSTNLSIEEVVAIVLQRVRAE